MRVSGSSGKAALLILLGSGPEAQGKAETAGFVTRLGNDTVWVERVTRTPSSIEGDIVYRNPRARRLHYAARLDSRGHVSRFELSTGWVAAPSDAPPLLERVTTVRDTVLDIRVRRNGAADTANSGVRYAPPGAVPFVQSGTAFTEQVLRQWASAKRDSVSVPMFTFGPNAAFPAFVRRSAGGEVEINAGAPFFARVDARGRLLSLSGRATTVKTETERVPGVDIEAVATSWAERDASSGAAGAISTRDTVRATIGAASVWVDYGRPARRGRVVFGELVPYDTVWRTGANAATQLSTSAPLEIGGATIPAGTYSLWTIPHARGGATLVINTQSGQWGTQYDSTQNLVRVPMRLETVASPTERLTIGIAPSGDASELRIDWDSRRYIVALRSR